LEQEAREDRRLRRAAPWTPEAQPRCGRGFPALCAQSRAATGSAPRVLR
jgi:hypothetical protein